MKLMKIQNFNIILYIQKYLLYNYVVFIKHIIINIINYKLKKFTIK